MTRDEAIAIYRVRTLATFDVAKQAVDGFVALGLLKLDEVKSATQRAIDAMVLAGFRDVNYVSADGVAVVLDAAGLKIVEK